jgi:hypothetical protein
MKFEFLLCGSPNDAFYAQFAMFRRSLDELGAEYRDARVVAVLGAPRRVPVPKRWERYLERVEIVWADCEDYLRVDTYAQGDLRYELIRSDADLAFLCDADTLFFRPLPTSLCAELRASGEVCGTVAHYPPPIDSRLEDLSSSVQALLHRALAPRPGLRGWLARNAKWMRHRIPVTHDTPNEELWAILGATALGRAPRHRYAYTLQEPGSRESCPFYVNYGFIGGTPKALSALYKGLVRLQPVVAERVGKEMGFWGQIAIALAAEELPHRALPLRFNYPNDPRADRLYPEEMESIVLMHYLRTERYDRHRVFVEPEAFESLLASTFSGSDALFQERVRSLTRGAFPFPEAIRAPRRGVAQVTG